jgi:hypothetical protein
LSTGRITAEAFADFRVPHAQRLVGLFHHEAAPTDKGPRCEAVVLSKRPLAADIAVCEADNSALETTRLMSRK